MTMAIEDLQRTQAAHRRMFQLAKQGKLDRPEACGWCSQPGGLKWLFLDYKMPLDSVAWLCPTCWRNPDVRSAIRNQKQEMIMATQRGTFASWLALQGSRPQSDPIGWLARAWDSFAGDSRPRLSSPVSIGKFLSEHGSQETAWQNGLAEAVEAATIAYREAGQAPAGEQPSPPADGEQLEIPLAGHDAPGDVAQMRTGDLAMADDLAEHAGDSARDTMVMGQMITYLMRAVDQLQAQAGLVLQMLAVSNPAAAQVLIEQTSAAQLASSEVLVDEPSLPQNLAHEIAERNGWLAHQGPVTLAGGFEQWWDAAQPTGDGDG
jgi:hypothetical protein